MKTRRLILIGLTTLLIASMVGFILWRNMPTAQLEWNLGDQQLMYAFDFKNSGKLHLSTSLTPSGQGFEQGPALPFSIDIQDGRLWLQQSPASSRRLQITLEPSQLEIVLGDLTGNDRLALQHALKKPFDLELNAEGAITSYYFEEGSPILARNIQRLISNAFFPPLSTEAQQREALAGIENFEVSIGRRFGFMEIEQTFRKLTVENAPGVEGLMTGHFQYAWDSEQKHLMRVAGQREITLVRDQQEISKDRVELHAELLNMRTKPLAAESKNLARFTAQGQEGYAAAERQMLLKTVEHANFEDELKGLLQSEGKKDIISQRAAFEKLLAFVKLNPDLMTRIRLEMEGLNPRDELFDLLATVLAKSGWVQGQELILDLARDHADKPETVALLLLNIALLPEPDPVVVKSMDTWLRATPTDHDLWSYLAAQTAGAAFHLQDHTVTQHLSDYLLPLLDERSTQSGAANALGNLGSGLSLPKAQTLLQSAEPDRRALGLMVLRRVQGQDSNQIILSSSEHDADQEVRRTAASLIKARKLDSSDIHNLGQRLSRERDLIVAQEIIDGLAAQSAQQRSTVKFALESYLEQCGTPEICQLLRSRILSL